VNVITLTLALVLASVWEPATPPPSEPNLTQQSQDVSSDKIPSVNEMVARFTKYRIAIVRKGPKWTKDTPAQIESTSARRGDHWKPLINQGKLRGVVRPVKPGEIWGLVFFKVDTQDEMDAIVADAPAVKEGFLAADIQAVWGSRGLGEGQKMELSGAAEPKGETYYLVVSSKGPKWTDKADAPETREASGEAMKYLYGLYKGGSLRYFAALEDFSSKVRTISILKAASVGEAKNLALGNPAIRKGMQVAEVYEVKVPVGMVP
jgi:muconolactone delta-isomerase